MRVAGETLLNCSLREGGAWVIRPAAELPEAAQPGDTHVAELMLTEDSRLLAGIRHLSATGRHRFRLPVVVAVDGRMPVPATLERLAGLLVGELGADGADPGPLLDRIHASAEAVTTFLAARHDEVDALWSARPLSFVASEQALLLGHLLHPTPKSRGEMSEAALRAYSPELAARFQLHWLAVDPGLVEHDSATGTPAPQLAEALLRDDPEVDGGALDAALAGLGERVLLPVHPWELRTCAATTPSSPRCCRTARSSTSARSAARWRRRRRCARSATRTGAGS